MSYKIVDYALVKNINKAYTINLRPPEAGTTLSTAMTASDRARCKLPDPWLLDSESASPSARFPQERGETFLNARVKD
jgi:hypothetical protein